MTTGNGIERKSGVTTVSAFIAASLGLGYLVPHLNERWLSSFATPLGTAQVIAFLSALSTGMMAFTGIVFSLLLVLIQFGTTAYTPRIVGVWVRNRSLSTAAGVFVGTFLYSLMALQGVGTQNGTTSGALTLGVAFAWLIGSVFMLVRLIQMFTALSHTNVLYQLGDTGQDAIARLCSPYAAARNPTAGSGANAEWLGPPSQIVLHTGRPLYLRTVDVERVVALARQYGCVIRIPYAVGDSITGGASLALVYGSGPIVPAEPLRKAISLGRERLLEHDPKYALRLLVDIAIRALSPAVCDPTTAVQALDQIEALLTSLGNAALDFGETRDGSGDLRLVLDATTWQEYLELGVAEIQQLGAEALQVQRRLAALFGFLRAHVPEGRRAAVDRFAQHRTTAVHGAFADVVLRARAELSDRQGLGHTHSERRPPTARRGPRLPAP
jgi:uncharacterized membrane protein